MEKSKTYQRARFSPEILQEAKNILFPVADANSNIHGILAVKVDGVRWDHDNENEFFSDYRRSNNYASFWRDRGELSLRVDARPNETEVSIKAPNRAVIEKVFAVFEANLQKSLLPESTPVPKPKPTIFIGHGQSTAWRDLKDHLHDQHDYPVEAYEIGSRAGHTIRDVLEDMLDSSSFAI